MSLYNLRTAELGYRVTKFDSDLNVESSYNVTPSTCDCPQGHKPTCRHRKMLWNLLQILDTEFFWDYDEHCYYDAQAQCKTFAPLAAPAGPSIMGSPTVGPGLRRRV